MFLAEASLLVVCGAIVTFVIWLVFVALCDHGDI